MPITLESNYYQEIDTIPLFNYRKALSGKHGYCRKVWNDGTKALDEQAWQLVYDDYLRTFGLGHKYEQFIELQLELIDLNLTFAESGDRFTLNRINQINAEMESMINRGEGMDMDDLIVFVLKSGYQIDEQRITAKQFYKILNNCIKENQLRNGKANKE